MIGWRTWKYRSRCDLYMSGYIYKFLFAWITGPAWVQVVEASLSFSNILISRFSMSMSNYVTACHTEWRDARDLWTLIYQGTSLNVVCTIASDYLLTY